VIHPYIDALWRLQKREKFQPADVERIDCPVAAFIVPIVCEPLAEKLAPASDSHGRVSLQYTLAEALYRGVMGKHAYQPESLANAEILALAARVRYHVDPEFPGPGHFRGAVRVTLKDGRTVMEVEEYNRGSAQNPMTGDELRGKFDENASGFLSTSERDRVAGTIERLEQLPDASVLPGLAIGASRGSGEGK
jgi:2-methylcitrate dehydratase PrpD